MFTLSHNPQIPIDYTLYVKVLQMLSRLSGLLEYSFTPDFYKYTISLEDAYLAQLAPDVSDSYAEEAYNKKKVRVACAGKKSLVELNPREKFTIDYNNILWEMYTQNTFSNPEQLHKNLNLILEAFEKLQDNSTLNTHNSTLPLGYCKEISNSVSSSKLVSEPLLQAPFLYKNTIGTLLDHPGRSLMARTVLLLYLCQTKLLQRPVLCLHQNILEPPEVDNDVNYTEAFLRMMENAILQTTWQVREIRTGMDITFQAAHEKLRFYLHEMHELIYSKFYVSIPEMESRSLKRSRLAIDKYINQMEKVAIVDMFSFGRNTVYVNPDLERIFSRQDWKENI